MQVGDVAQVMGTVREVQHLQGEQYNVRLETQDGETLWLQAHLLRVVIAAPKVPGIENGAPVPEPGEAAPQNNAPDGNGWRHENAAWVRPNPEVTAPVVETPAEEAETETEAPPEAETTAKV